MKLIFNRQNFRLIDIEVDSTLFPSEGEYCNLNISDLIALNFKVDLSFEIFMTVTQLDLSMEIKTHYFLLLRLKT